MSLRRLFAVSLSLLLTACASLAARGDASAPSEEWAGVSAAEDFSGGFSGDVDGGPDLRQHLDKDGAVHLGFVEAGQGGAAEPAAPAVDRQVIYSARLAIVVVSVAEAQASVLAYARELGGHLQQSDASSVTVRVPAAKFDEALTRMARLGEVVARDVNAADVTEELFDLDIRIDNARKARERLLEHLAKSEKIEDTLKIEVELTRLTEELERMEGRKRFLASQVALSTIRVELNSNSPQGPANDGLVVPFDWIERLGDGLVAGALATQPRAPRFLASGPRFDVPAGFLRYYQSKTLVEAMDADGVRVKVQVHDNHDEGDLVFWQKLARRALVEGRSLVFDTERMLANDRALMRGTREVSGEPYGYLIVLVRTEKRVLTYEAFGPKARFDEVAAALEASAASLRP